MTRSLHLMGIAGAGMSALARVAHGRGLAVSGCDRSEAGVAKLRDEGIDALVGHDPSHLQPGMELVVSGAVAETEPELARARELGFVVLHRAELLAELVAERRSICVAGTHGKTTTSALIAYVLSELGEDPTFLVGGQVRQLGTNARAGKGPLLVAEADESDGSLARLAPACAIVLNVELDHHDHFASVDELRALFAEWTSRVPAAGLVVLGDGLDLPVAAEVRRAGSGPGEGWRALESVARGSGSRFTLAAPGREQVTVELGIPGEHNAANAVAALAALDWAGIAPERAIAPLAGFVGAGRRFEHHGEVAGIRLVDDYAHHPSEITATLAAARPLVGEGRLIACFQPHMPWRARAFAREFADALGAAEIACVCDVYVARGAAEEGVTGALITDLAPERLTFTPTYADAARFIVERAEPGDLVLTMGAGPVDGVLALVRAQL